MKALTARRRAFWREIEPGVSIDRHSSVERWDAGGEGRAVAVSFEGYGFTGMVVIGRTPRRRADA